MAIKKLKITELSEDILVILRKSAHVELSAFDIARADNLINQAEILHPACGHSFRGCLYGITGKNDESIEEHRIAVDLAPDDASFLANYAITLFSMSRFGEALDMYLNALTKDKSSLDAITGAVYAAYHSGDERLMGLLADYKARTGESHEVEEWLKEDKEDDSEIPAIMAEAEKDGYIPWEKAKKELGL